jgi:hypothetical protein
MWYLHTHTLSSPRITVTFRRQVEIYRLVKARKQVNQLGERVTRVQEYVTR